MSQKSRFRMQMQGITTFRHAFPQLPWSIIKEPTFIQTEHGNRLLTSGWWAYARKIVRTSTSSHPLSDYPLELHCWLVPISFMGIGRRYLLTYSLFLFRFLLGCPGSPMWSWLWEVCNDPPFLNPILTFALRCAIKYGEDWEKYCDVVPYKFIPGIY